MERKREDKRRQEERVEETREERRTREKREKVILKLFLISYATLLKDAVINSFSLLAFCRVCSTIEINGRHATCQRHNSIHFLFLKLAIKYTCIWLVYSRSDIAYFYAFKSIRALRRHEIFLANNKVKCAVKVDCWAFLVWSVNIDGQNGWKFAIHRLATILMASL